MAAETTTRAIRRGLPRVPGGEPWPPAAQVAQVEQVAQVAQVAPTVAAGPARIRRGLPRVAGGPAWPEVDEAALAAMAPAAAPAAPEPAPAVPVAEAAPEAAAFAAESAVAAAPAAPVPATRVPAPARVRRGLPRVAGGPAWPEVDAAALKAAAPVVAEEAPVAEPPQAEPEAAPVPAAPATASVAPPAPVAPRQATPAAPPLSSPRKAFAARAAQTPPASVAPAAEPRRYRGLTLAQWVWRSIGGVLAIAAFVGLVMLAARGLLTFAWARDFVHRYPGAYALPASAPVGFPLWVEWQHFLNAFLMLLIIRTGIQIRRETKPPASWSPRWDGKRRISLTVWLHQSLDLLWIVNGVAFVVALFATGQWMRVVPTSWAVFPNAFTAALKYASLNWPTEDGWANFNSLQQLSYFVVIFLLAPLAAITGVRMSGLWQKKWERASRVYPIQLARAIHFPTMVVFSVFIVVHVVLVLATGALRNLNHMFGHSDVVSWTGFWLFVAALVVMAAGWVAARPLVVSPIASLFGRVGR
jgi:thiosulfate reductase cytochrome b subunit